MELWDEEYRDLIVPAYIEFSKNRQGEFQFGTVGGWLDCRFSTRDGQSAVDFSWDGQRDNDPGSGRGWATLDGDPLRGHIFIHCSDDSSFVAKRDTSARSTNGHA
jgi:hypothetical protein